jgi:hypothetical protein
VKLTSVTSSSINAIGYDLRSGTLRVQFRDSGEVYAYFDVPPDVFAMLERAESKGRFVNYRIKPHYRCEKVRRIAGRGRRRSRRKAGARPAATALSS